MESTLLAFLKSAAQQLPGTLLSIKSRSVDAFSGSSHSQIAALLLGGVLSLSGLAYAIVSQPG